MTRTRVDLVARALRDTSQSMSWTARNWELLVRQAARADLLARLAALLQDDGKWDQIPAAPKRRLEVALRVASAHQDQMQREVLHIRTALKPLGVPVVLLKGAAYLMAGLTAARGRSFSDVDIMVPRARLAEVEAALMAHGWATTHHSPYDQRYYREWMHELPPMRHVQRQMVLDVHHAILPQTARAKPSSDKLLAEAVVIDESDGLRVLSPVDRVLHSMTHLFNNEEMSHGLRDLSDLDLLLRAEAGAEGFWRRLATRARELELERPLYYGLWCTNAVLRTPVPVDALIESRSARPCPPIDFLMSRLWLRALCTPHPSAASRVTPVALFLLYIRAHWLRMPPLMLLRHLTVKALGLGQDTPQSEESGTAGQRP